MSENTPIAKRPVIKFTSDANSESMSDSLVVEEPLEIRVRGKGIAVTMRTPGHDQELTAGFLLTEQVIRDFSDVMAIEHCQRGESADTQNVVNAFLSPGVEFNEEKLTRHVFASSSCGLCGKATIDSIHQSIARIDNAKLEVSKHILATLPTTLIANQTVFDTTGGLHAAAIFDTDGKLIVLREDVGRHNAVDKVIGYGFLNRLLPYQSHVLLISGRASFEIMQKSLAAGIPVVAAVSAPSSLAFDFARESNQTLIGFLRDNRMNIYTHEERISL